MRLRTPRLELVAAMPELLRAELAAPTSLAQVLDAKLPADWPPGYYDRDAAEWTLASLTPDSIGWWLWYVVWLGQPRVLVAAVGFKGPPEEGVCEIGYSVSEAFRGRDIAPEACRALIAWAFERGAREVVAETYPHLAASLRVMDKLGMTPRADASEPGVVRRGVLRASVRETKASPHDSEREMRGA